ncbi:MAG TPA: ATP-binding protein [Solirubrobacterales bacterium]|nr:ATP-binding protein [Solirubrobacterales bacterium]
MTAPPIEGEPTAPSVVSLKVCHPGSPDVVPNFRHAAVDFAAAQGADPELCQDIALAVSEAVTNAVKHADAHEDETISLTASVADDWLEIRVLDRGVGFGNPASDGLGLGLSIIARLSAHLTISQEGRGTELIMRFPLPRR